MLELRPVGFGSFAAMASRRVLFDDTDLFADSDLTTDVEVSASFSDSEHVIASNNAVS